MSFVLANISSASIGNFDFATRFTSPSSYLSFTTLHPRVHRLPVGALPRMHLVSFRQEQVTFHSTRSVARPAMNATKTLIYRGLKRFRRTIRRSLPRNFEAASRLEATSTLCAGDSPSPRRWANRVQNGGTQNILSIVMLGKRDNLCLIMGKEGKENRVAK